MVQLNNNSLVNVSFIYDLSLQQFTYINSNLQSLLKSVDDQILQPRIIKQIHPEDLRHLIKCYQELLEGKPVGTVQFRLIADEKELWIRLTPFLMQSSGNPVIVVSASDITAEIHNFYIINKYANKKNSILNMLSHDLRGPLSVAQNLVNALEEKLDDTKLTNLAKNISVILRKSIDLITDLTNREFLDTMEVQLFKKNIDISTKTAEYMEECRRSQELAGRSLTFKSSCKEIYIDVDEAKFMQIYNNLLSNALKFTREGGHILFTIEERENSVLFTCSDDGIGIPEEFIPVLFEEFTDAKRTGLRGEPTLGLGLFVVKTIVSWHDGTVWVESKENAGTTFYIEIPK